MRVVQVDAVDLQAAQRILRAALDLRARQALAEAGHVHADLGGDDHAVTLAALAQPAADHALRFAAHMARHPRRVDVRGVDEVAAGRGVAVEQRMRSRLVGGPAEHVAAETER